MEVDITACSGNGIRVAPGDLFDFLTLPIVFIPKKELFSI